jgi:hypothetical protein
MTSCDVYDSETTISDTDTADVSYPGRLAVSPGGSLLRLAGSGLRISKDGGASWTGISGSGAWGGDFSDAGVCNAGEDTTWILAKNQGTTFCGVYYTPDNGITWIDKIGNLRNYFTSDFQIKAIKAIL